MAYVTLFCPFHLSGESCSSLNHCRHICLGSLHCLSLHQWSTGFDRLRRRHLSGNWSVSLLNMEARCKSCPARAPIIHHCVCLCAVNSLLIAGALLAVGIIRVYAFCAFFTKVISTVINGVFRTLSLAS